jgi:hypothetical protein
MLDALIVGAPDAERDRVVYVLDDRADVAFDLAERLSRRTAMLPQPMSKPTPEMLICFS